jgi:Mn2+/Fe2+ NRAMP family transporter
MESESEGILGGVGVGRNFYVESESVNMYRLRIRPQSKILTRYSITRALIATITVRLILKYRL